MVIYNPYEHGKIYKIWSLQTQEIYVGSTCQALHKRMHEHRRNTIEGKGFKLYKVMRELGIDVFSIELVENYPCKNREELRKREGFWVRHLQASLNVKIPGRTLEEYRNDNREQLREAHRKFYEANKETIKSKVKAYAEQNISTIKLRSRAYYEKHKERFKLYREINSDRIKLRESERNHCDICGGKYRTSHRAVHLSTRKHQKAIEKQ